tara:strand:- start:74 stop:667 length:594 start_codon:yes stop_codon:yes gene_type:complete
MDHDEQQMEIIENLTEELGEKELIIMKQEKEIIHLRNRINKHISSSRVITVCSKWLFDNDDVLDADDPYCVVEDFVSEFVSFVNDTDKLHENEKKMAIKKFFKIHRWDLEIEMNGDDSVILENIEEYYEEMCGNMEEYDSDDEDYLDHIDSPTDFIIYERICKYGESWEPYINQLSHVIDWVIKLPNDLGYYIKYNN